MSYLNLLGVLVVLSPVVATGIYVAAQDGVRVALCISGFVMMPTLLVALGVYLITL